MGFRLEHLAEAALDPSTGLSAHVLSGDCRQNVKDAEQLLSVHVAKWLRQHSYQQTAHIVAILADWHRASDDRGMTPAQRLTANHDMLAMLLDEMMPWHRKEINFAFLDVNM